MVYLYWIWAPDNYELLFLHFMMFQNIFGQDLVCCCWRLPLFAYEICFRSIFPCKGCLDRLEVFIRGGRNLGWCFQKVPLQLLPSIYNLPLVNLPLDLGVPLWSTQVDFGQILKRVYLSIFILPLLSFWVEWLAPLFPFFFSRSWISDHLLLRSGGIMQHVYYRMRSISN